MLNGYGNRFMQTDDIIQALTYNQGFFPKAAVVAAMQQQEALTPILLDELRSIIQNPAHPVFTDEGDYFLHIYALFLLAYWREQQAFPLMMDFFNHESIDHYALLGEVTTEDTTSLLLSVFNGDMDSVGALVKNAKVDVFMRMSVMDAYLAFYHAEYMTQSVVEGALRDFFVYFSHPDTYDKYMLSAVTVDLGEIGYKAILPAIEKAFADDLIDTSYTRLQHIQQDMQENHWQNLQPLHKDHYIGDLVDRMEWWACFQPVSKRDAGFEADDAEFLADIESDWPAPYQAPQKIGRNAPCPCGSGKKYKKCCIG